MCTDCKLYRNCQIINNWQNLWEFKACLLHYPIIHNELTRKIRQWNHLCILCLFKNEKTCTIRWCKCLYRVHFHDWSTTILVHMRQERQRSRRVSWPRRSSWDASSAICPWGWGWWSAPETTTTPERSCCRWPAGNAPHVAERKEVQLKLHSCTRI